MLKHARAKKKTPKKNKIEGVVLLSCSLVEPLNPGIGLELIIHKEHRRRGHTQVGLGQQLLCARVEADEQTASEGSDG